MEQKYGDGDKHEVTSAIVVSDENGKSDVIWISLQTTTY